MSNLPCLGTLCAVGNEQNYLTVHAPRPHERHAGAHSAAMSLGGFSNRNYVSGMLSRTTRSISVGLGRRLTALGVGFGQYLVLVRLWRSSPAPLTQADLVADLAVERSSMSTLLRSMERSGLVHRCTDPVDRRRLVVSLTEHASALELPVLRLVDAYEKDLVGAMARTELAALYRTLEQLQQRAFVLRTQVDTSEEGLLTPTRKS